MLCIAEVAAAVGKVVWKSFLAGLLWDRRLQTKQSRRDRLRAWSSGKALVLI